MIASAWKASLSISLMVVSTAAFKDADLSPFGLAVAGLQMLAAVTLWFSAFTTEQGEAEQEDSASENPVRGYRARQQKAKVKGGAA
jgi:hypothetical protein